MAEVVLEEKERLKEENERLRKYVNRLEHMLGSSSLSGGDSFEDTFNVKSDCFPIDRNYSSASINGEQKGGFLKRVASIAQVQSYDH